MTATGDRTPVWGDASDLIDLLDVRPEGDGRFVSTTRASESRSVVEGSQMLAQAVVACGRRFTGRRPASAHMLFVRAADDRVPLAFEVTELSNGRSFGSLRVDVTQSGRTCASGTVLAGTVTADVVRHSVAAPDVAGPYESEPFDMKVAGRDIRVVDAAYTGDPDAPVGPPIIDAWVRFDQVPEDPFLHAGLLVQFTGHMSIAAALRPHAGVGQDQAHRSLSTAVNAIAVSLHADVRADRWMLYHHLSTFAGDGMTHSEGRVHDEQGRLLASFSVDAMVRRFDEPNLTIPKNAVL
jgi:acyl-CoA thioesterase-2